MTNQYTITLSDAQDKALRVVVQDPQDWIENAVFERCRLSIEEIVRSEIERKLAAGETISGSKDDIVLEADIESYTERTSRILSELQQ